MGSKNHFEKVAIVSGSLWIELGKNANSQHTNKKTHR